MSTLNSIKNAIDNGTFIFASDRVCAIYDKNKKEAVIEGTPYSSRVNVRDIIHYVKERKFSDEYYRTNNLNLVINLKNINNIKFTVEFQKSEITFITLGYRVYVPIKSLPNGFFNEHPEYLDILKKDIKRRNEEIAAINRNYEFLDLILPNLSDEQRLFLNL